MGYLGDGVVGWRGREVAVGIVSHRIVSYGMVSYRIASHSIVSYGMVWYLALEDVNLLDRLLHLRVLATQRTVCLFDLRLHVLKLGLRLVPVGHAHATAATTRAGGGRVSVGHHLDVGRRLVLDGVGALGVVEG